MATAALGSPYHPSVVYLQCLREELRQGGRIARQFISAVNRVYGSFSPCLAAHLETHTPARIAVREWIVRPTVAIISATDCVTRRIQPDSVRQTVLVGLLAAEAILGIVSLPMLALSVFAIMALRFRPIRPPGQEGAE